MGDPRDMISGATLQVIEAVTLGMPFEVWKTRQGAHPEENCVKSFQALWRTNGPKTFWAGSSAKVAEAASKGAVLLYAKEGILDMCEKWGMERQSGTTGALAGAGGGVVQSICITPLTYVVTYKMKNPDASHKGSVQILKEAGLGKAFASLPAVAGRQSSNWALRQGLTDALVRKYKETKGRKLTTIENICCGLLGGCLSCINQPFEVMRIMQQSRAAKGEQGVTMRNTAALVYQKHGVLGFYVGLVPRMLLAAWQTLFMVTFASMVREAMNAPKKTGH